MSDEPLSRRRRALFGLVGAGVIAGAAVAVGLGSVPSHAGSTHYTASFGRAGQGLDPGRSDVKLRGIKVGTVETVELERTGRVSVRVRVDPGIRVPTTARAVVEPVSVFGPKDIVIEPGSGELTGPYLADGGRITRTRDPQDLAETAWPAYRLTQAVDPDEVGAILRTLSAGLSGQGAALRRTVANSGTVVDGAYANRAVINGLINDIAGLSDTFGDRGGTITATVRDLNRIAPVLADRPDKVGRLLDESAALAGRVGATMRTHGADIGSIIDGGARTASVVSSQRQHIPVLIDSLNGFFRLLAGVIRVEGPQGTLLAQSELTLPLDLCQIFVDMCGTTPRTTAFGSSATPEEVMSP